MLKRKAAIALFTTAGLFLVACGPAVIGAAVSGGGGGASAPAEVTLTIELSGTGTGTVVSTPAGINCPGGCSHKFPKGKSVLLTPMPGSDSAFRSWTGAGLQGLGPDTVVMDSDQTVTAKFDLAPKFPTGNTLDVTGNAKFVAMGYLDPDGRPDLVVATQSTVSVHLNTTLAPGSVSFSGPTAVAPVTGALAVAVADFNLDGKADLGIANDDISILTGNGQGGFPSLTVFAPSANPVSLTVGDFDIDGKPDIAFVDGVSSSVFVLRNTTSRTSPPAAVPSFDSPVPFAQAGVTPVFVATSDLTRDGRLDLVVANRNSNRLTILKQDPPSVPPALSFSFEANPSVDSAPGSHEPLCVEIGDFDRDGFLDLASANSTSDNVSILLNQHTSPLSFENPALYPLGLNTHPSFLASGDFNHDGIDDLAVTNEFGHSFSILVGADAGAFLEPFPFPLAPSTVPTSVAVGDCDRDGKPDLAVTNDAGQDNVDVLLNQTVIVPSGKFNVEDRNLDAPPGPRSVTVGDWNRDGKPDISVANLAPGVGSQGRVTTLAGPLLGAVQSTAIQVLGTETFFLVADDFDEDGDMDFAVSHRKGADANKVSILLQDGNGVFAVNSTIVVLGELRGLAVGDFNCDGAKDLAVANHSTHKVAISLGNGHGGFGSASSFSTGGTNPRSVAVGDFNEDGKQDLAVANHGSDNIGILLGDGTGTFATVNQIISSPPELAKPQAVAAGDLDGDGDIDLVVANETTDKVSILLGDPVNGFSVGSSPSVGDCPFHVAIGDLNADGKADIVVANSGVDVLASGNQVGSISILMGGIGPAQTISSLFPVNSEQRSVAIADINRDGRPDLVVGNAGNSTVSILLNRQP